MSRLVFEDGDPGNLPVMLDATTGKPVPRHDPVVRAMEQVFLNQTTLDQRRAWHAVTCLNSRDPATLTLFHEVHLLLQQACERADAKDQEQLMNFSNNARLWDRIRANGPHETAFSKRLRSLETAELMLDQAELIIKWPLENKFPDDRIMKDVDEIVVETQRRHYFLEQLSFAVPTLEAVRAIVKFAEGSILEVGAGRGLWARLIHQEGGNILPTDPHADEDRMIGGSDWPGLNQGTTFFPIMNLDGVAAVRSPLVGSAGTLMFVWPGMEEWPTEALRNFRGERVVFVGERGGCTALDSFHELLEAEWLLDEDIVIPQWEGIHDRVFLYKSAPRVA